MLLDDQVTLHWIRDTLPPFLELWMNHKPLPCPSWVRQGYSAARKANGWQLDNWTVARKMTFSWTKRKKKKKQQKATTKMTAATTKMTATTTKTPQHPRMVEGSQGTLKPEKPSTGGCWHTEVWGRDEKIHTECSGRGNCSCIRPWSLFLCKPCRPSPLCGKCLIPGVFFPRRERKC